MIHLVLSDLLSEALGILLEGKKKVKGKKPFTQETVLEKVTEKEKNCRTGHYHKARCATLVWKGSNWKQQLKTDFGCSIPCVSHSNVGKDIQLLSMIFGSEVTIFAQRKADLILGHLLGS